MSIVKRLFDAIDPYLASAGENYSVLKINGVLFSGH
jgi:hypothetical protein